MFILMSASIRGRFELALTWAYLKYDDKAMMNAVKMSKYWYTWHCLRHVFCNRIQPRRPHAIFLLTFNFKTFLYSRKTGVQTRWDENRGKNLKANEYILKGLSIYVNPDLKDWYATFEHQLPAVPWFSVWYLQTVHCTRQSHFGP